MIRQLAAALLAFTLLAGAAQAQPADSPLFDTSYRASPSISARLQRKFLTDIRWSVGANMRDGLAAAFAEKAPVEIWQELVAPDGLEPGNVTDALTAYWILSWVTANAAYDTTVDAQPIRRQLAAAFAADRNFRTLSDQQRQELAEGYILDFLVQHAAVNTAVERKDIDTLSKLAVAAVANFRQKMGVDLLTVAPGPNGFQPKRAQQP